MWPKNSSTTTTLPFQACPVALVPDGACSNFQSVKGGAGVPFAGCAQSEARSRQERDNSDQDASQSCANVCALKCPLHFSSE